MNCSTTFLNSWDRAKVLICLLLCAGGVAGAGEPRPPHDAHVEAHWAYMGIEGPEHWGMLGSAYMACENGSHQSPIDISMPRHAQRQEQLTLHYQPSRAQILNTGHTIQVNLQPGNVLHLSTSTADPIAYGSFISMSPASTMLMGSPIPWSCIWSIRMQAGMSLS